MTHADGSHNRLTRMIVAVFRFLGRMFGLYRPAPSAVPTPDANKLSEEAQQKATKAEKHLRFRRALLMLDLAVAHARHEFPDSARGLLNAAWHDLESNPAARTQWHATTALVFALGTNVRQATSYLNEALNEYESTYDSLSPVVRHRIYQLCIAAMEQLPHNRQVEQLTGHARAAHQQGDFVMALRLLDQADTVHAQYARHVSPRTTRNRLDAWYAILEDMKNRGGSSTRTILDAFRDNTQYAPA